MAYSFAINGLALKTGDLICTVDGGGPVIPGEFWRLIGKIIPGEVDHIVIYIGPGVELPQHVRTAITYRSALRRCLSSG